MPEYPIEYKQNSLLLRRLAKVQKNLVIDQKANVGGDKSLKNEEENTIVESQNDLITSTLKDKEVENILLNQSTLDSKNLYTNHILYIKNPSGFYRPS